MSQKPVIQLEATTADIIYPESDGQPMADNTLQFNTIVNIKTNLDILFEEDEVFVAGDLFWYPVQGSPRKVLAPDVMVAFDRPKGYRSSYKQWEEDGIAPAVVFEVLSNSNSASEMIRKAIFYQNYGVEEFIIVNPYTNKIEVYVRKDDELNEINLVSNIWKSEKLGITIEMQEDQLNFFYPDGQPFLMPEQWKAAREKERAEKEYERAEKEKERAEKEYERAEKEKERAEKEYERAEKEKERTAKEEALTELERLKAELARLKK